MKSSIAKDREQIFLSDITIDVVRRPRRKCITLKVIKGQTMVLASKSTPKQALIEFAESKIKWIQKCLSAYHQTATRFPTADGDPIRWMGKEVKIRRHFTPLRKAFVVQKSDELQFFVPRDQLQRELMELTDSFIAAIKHLAIMIMTEKFWQVANSPIVKAHITKPVKELKWRKNRGRWGSCSSNGVINLNWKLIALPPHLIEYVIAHELAHLRHLNHSNQFWNLLSVIIPDALQMDRELNQVQHWADFLDGL